MNVKQCENECPKCNGLEPLIGYDYEIEWEPREYIGDEIAQKGHCNRCGCNFIEYYAYKETEWEK